MTSSWCELRHLPGNAQDTSPWYRSIDGLEQDCSDPIANALELLQSYTKPSLYCTFHVIATPPRDQWVDLLLNRPHAYCGLFTACLPPIDGIIPYSWVHYNDVIMSTMASQITGVTIVYSTVCTGADQRKHQSSALLAFVRGIHRWPVNSPRKRPLTRKILPFDDVIVIFRGTPSS